MRVAGHINLKYFCFVLTLKWMALGVRHSRESGNPCLYFTKVKIDSRFRGNDGGSANLF